MDKWLYCPVRGVWLGSDQVKLGTRLYHLLHIPAAKTMKMRMTYNTLDVHFRFVVDRFLTKFISTCNSISTTSLLRLTDVNLKHFLEEHNLSPTPKEKCVLHDQFFTLLNKTILYETQ